MTDESAAKRREHEKKLREEISQARKERDEFVARVELSKTIEAMETKRLSKTPEESKLPVEKNTSQVSFSFGQNVPSRTELRQAERPKPTALRNSSGLFYNKSFLLCSTTVSSPTQARRHFPQKRAREVNDDAPDSDHEAVDTVLASIFQRSTKKNRAS